ncbi:unnamed protein product, partial [Ectocarpus sp. 4 AP-2014]
SAKRKPEVEGERRGWAIGNGGTLLVEQSIPVRKGCMGEPGGRGTHHAPLPSTGIKHAVTCRDGSCRAVMYYGGYFRSNLHHPPYRKQGAVAAHPTLQQQDDCQEE